MKILIYADPHYSAYSSIVRSRGQRFSTRIENELNSINWVEETATIYGCNAVVCLGDFFDRSDLSPEELTGLAEIRWASMPHYFLVGNHEMGLNNLQFSSAHLFNLTNCYVIDKPITMPINDSQACLFLPYMLEGTREEFKKYLPEAYNSIIVFSHNDLQIQYGRVLSQNGFTVDEIENSNCSLFLNGHIHNFSQVSNKIINVGNLTGINFSEDATVYSHNVVLLDTDTLQMTLLENPYAFNFYKVDFTQTSSYNIFNRLKPNAVVSILCNEEDVEVVRDLVAKNTQIIESKISVQRQIKELNETFEVLLKTDHWALFQQYILETLGNDESISHELREVLQ